MSATMFTFDYFFCWRGIEGSNIVDLWSFPLATFFGSSNGFSIVFWVNLIVGYMVFKKGNVICNLSASFAKSYNVIFNENFKLILLLFYRFHKLNQNMSPFFFISLQVNGVIIGFKHVTLVGIVMRYFLKNWNSPLMYVILFARAKLKHTTFIMLLNFNIAVTAFQ